MEGENERSESQSLKHFIRTKLLRFDVLLAIALILLALTFILVWAFIVMPYCNESGWKAPCPPKGFVS
jgi:hypothetical protein